MTKTGNMIVAVIAGAMIGAGTVMCMNTAFATQDTIDSDQSVYTAIYEADFTGEDMEMLVKEVDPAVVKEVSGELGTATINQYLARFAKEDPGFRPVIAKFLDERQE